MQLKTIKKVVSDKVNEWLNSVTDGNLRERMRGSLLVTGGSIASMLRNEQVNDFDIYFQDRDVLIDVVKYYIKTVPSASIWLGENKDQLIKAYKGDFDKDQNYFTCALRNLKEDQVKIFIDYEEGSSKGGMAFDKKESPNYDLAYLSPNAISLTNDVQIVVRFFGTPSEIHKNFDFVHATNYFTFKSGVVVNKEALISLMTNQLKYKGSLYPLTSVIRAKKFLKRGFNISAGEYLKMIFQISLLDLTNVDVLEEQLIGVDVAYFSTLIEALRNHKTTHPEFVLDKDYLTSLIDKIFNDESSED